MRQRDVVRPLGEPVSDPDEDDVAEALEENAYKDDFAQAFFLVVAFCWGCLALAYIANHEEEIVLEIEGLPAWIGHKLSAGSTVVVVVCWLGYRFWTTP